MPILRFPRCEFCGRPDAFMCQVCEHFSCAECLVWRNDEECMHEAYNEEEYDEWLLEKPSK